MLCRAISSCALLVSASASSGKPVASAFASSALIRVSMRGSPGAGGRWRWSAVVPGTGPTGSIAGSRSSSR